MLQVGAGLLQHFKGQAAELVAAAGQSAVALVQLLTAHFPGFRDHSIYKGRQVSLLAALCCDCMGQVSCRHAQQPSSQRNDVQWHGMLVK